MKLILRLSVLLAVAMIAAVAAKAGDLRVFGPDCMRAIENSYAGDRFIVAVWSTDCLPCRRELEILGAFAAEHPEVPIVLLATDPPENAEAVMQVLEWLKPPGAAVWQFGDAGAERLRYAIDPGWSGEMPRSYLYGYDGKRVGISGPISQELLEHWLDGSKAESGQ